MSSTRAAIYVRISRDLDGTGLGVARQRKDCEALAKRLGWSVVEVYDDNDTSATNGKPRPGYERMMRDAGAGRLDAVLVWDVDRLTRTPRELEDVIDHAGRLGLKLASVGGDIDLGTEQGRMLARMKGTVARYEVEQASRRIKAKHKELAAAGQHVGPRPFGWDFAEDRRLVVNHAEAEVVRECVRRVLRGEGLWRIRNDLNERGIRTSTGGEWQTQTLRRMLLRWRNAGVRTHKGQEAGPGQWQALIARETHERVISILTDPRRRANNRGTAVKYLLTGIARCGVCERSVVGTNAFTYEVNGYRRKGEETAPRKVRHYPHAYKCPHTGCMKVQRRMADVDELVEQVVVGLLERDGVRVLGGDPSVAEEARTRIGALEAKLALAADHFAADEWTAEQVQRVNAKLRPELEAERARLRRSMPAESLEEFAGASASAAWAHAGVETRRRILSVLGDAIGMRIVLDRVGSGNGASFDPRSVRIEFQRIAESLPAS